MIEQVMPQEWRSGLVDIRDQAQTTLGPQAMAKADVTPDVIDLANSIWGSHDISPDMGLNVIAKTATMDPPYLYAQDRVLQDRNHSHAPLQGAYINPDSGLLVIQQPDALFAWLDGRELPPESPFAKAFELCVEQFGVDALRTAVGKLSEARTSRIQFVERAAEQRQIDEAKIVTLEELSNTHPFLTTLTEGMSDLNRRTFAEHLYRLRRNGMMVWDPKQWNVTGYAPRRTDAELLMGQDNPTAVTSCVGPGAICELNDFGGTRRREYVDFTNTYADHAIIRWMSSDAGNHGDRKIVPIEHAFTDEERRLVELQFPLATSYLGRAPQGKVVWGQPLERGYMVHVSQQVKSDHDESVYSQSAGTIYVPNSTIYG